MEKHKLHESGEFCSCGADTYVCQMCGRICCGAEEPSSWERIRTLTSTFNGNICPLCKQQRERQALYDKFDKR